MNTKLNNITVSPEFEDLLAFKNEEEKIEHNAQMISYRILSEVEKLCEEKKIKKKDLAEMVGTSKSYITQLFTGAKSVNTYIMAKFENALDITFEIKLRLNEESYGEFLGNQIDKEVFTNRRLSSPKGAFYYCEFTKQTEDIVNNLSTDSEHKQVA